MREVRSIAGERTNMATGNAGSRVGNGVSPDGSAERGVEANFILQSTNAQTANSPTANSPTASRLAANTSNASAESASAESNQAEDDGTENGRHQLSRQKRLGDVSGALGSVLFHVGLLLILSLFLLPQRTGNELFTSLWRMGDGDNEDAPVEIVVPAKGDAPEEVPEPQIESLNEILETDVKSPTLDELDDVEKPAPKDLADSGAEQSVADDGPEIDQGSLFGGRSSAQRAKLAATGGGSAESEAAVEAGLRWLQRHQKENGSWSFDHGGVDAGSLTNSHNGATAMALLAFLGAGYTHNDDKGPYRDTVRKGLEFLAARGQPVPARGLDYRGGSNGNDGMYIQAIVAIALCEAHGLSEDSKLLLKPARGAVEFIQKTQYRDGGWRYEVERLTGMGDLSVTGWQIMALKSAKIGRTNLGGIERTLGKTTKFLASVQSDGGATYGYISRSGPSPAMTAVGLLCRMYLGWKQERAELERGVARLSELGPSENDIYYNYYATQVMHHWGGKRWEAWNKVMRNRLVSTQVSSGPEIGSWRPTGDHGTVPGGRMYQTCFSVLTLEVYYRHLPLYRRKTVTAP